VCTKQVREYHKLFSLLTIKNNAKIGSTSIQHASRNYKEILKKDEYKLPWVGFTEHWGIRLGWTYNQIPFAACFVTRFEPNRNRCVPEMLQEGSSIARQHKNIFVSTEEFSRIEPNDIKKLSKYLNKRWDLVTIIVYYSRYYDYLRSVFNQTHKKRRLTHLHLWDSSFLDFLLDEIEHGPTSKYTFPLVSRLKQHVDNTRNNTNVVVMNFHDRSMDLSERFYCEAIPDAYHTCEVIRNSETSIHANPTVYLGYENLAYAACKANLVHANSKVLRNALNTAVKKHQEETLGLTRDDFKLKCLPPEILQRLLNKSLEYEKAVLPELDGSDLRADFEKQATSKLCIVDVEFTLSKPEWKDFFKNYTQ